MTKPKPPEEKKRSGRHKEKVADKVDLTVVAFLAERGLTDADLGRVFDKDEATINRWKADPEFLQALKDGKQIADGKVVASLYQRACGFTGPDNKYYPPSDVACIFWLKNRDKENWRDRVEHGGEGGGPIEIRVKYAD